MKSIFLSLVTALAFAHLAQAADVTVKISNVHLCCGGCVKGVARATADALTRAGLTGKVGQ